MWILFRLIHCLIEHFNAFTYLIATQRPRWIFWSSHTCTFLHVWLLSLVITIFWFFILLILLWLLVTRLVTFIILIILLLVTGIRLRLVLLLGPLIKIIDALFKLINSPIVNIGTIIYIVSDKYRLALNIDTIYKLQTLLLIL